MADVDAFCLFCGCLLASIQVAKDERSLGPVAAVTDIGRRRKRNEDAFGVLVRSDNVAAVVCDGVGSTADAGLAAAVAARVTVASLARLLPHGSGGAKEVESALQQTLGVVRAVTARVTGSGHAVPIEGSDPGPPSTTWVTGVCRDGLVTVAHVGDSRAYWLPDVGNARLLTADDAQDDVVLTSPTSGRAGLTTRLTRWVGADSDSRPATTFSLETADPGYLVLCSDGVWNYVAEPGDVAAVARGEAAAGEPRVLARRLVDHAVNAGGSDNATSAVLRHETGKSREA